MDRETQRQAGRPTETERERQSEKQRRRQRETETWMGGFGQSKLMQESTRPHFSRLFKYVEPFKQAQTFANAPSSCILHLREMK